eukprot:316054-Amphidinium_carterae.1
MSCNMLPSLQVSPEEHKVPIYNSMVAFDVPHWHAVSKVLDSAHTLYTKDGHWAVLEQTPRSKREKLT